MRNIHEISWASSPINSRSRLSTLAFAIRTAAGDTLNFLARSEVGTPSTRFNQNICHVFSEVDWRTSSKARALRSVNACSSLWMSAGSFCAGTGIASNEDWLTIDSAGWVRKWSTALRFTIVRSQPRKVPHWESFVNWPIPLKTERKVS